MKHESIIQVGVVGAGVMGQHHLKVYDAQKHVRITAIVDPDMAKAERLAREYDATAYPSIEALPSHVVDAVSVCSPSSHHASAGIHLLSRGIHCLVEKPLASSFEEGLQLVEAAKAHNAILLVGHIERFNPATIALSDLLPSMGRIQAIHIDRMGLAGARILDVGVIHDLMIHDLDILLHLVGESTPKISAKSKGDPAAEDHVSALLTFSSGLFVNITASRISARKRRCWHVITEQCSIELDLVAKELTLFRYPERLGNNYPLQPDYLMQRVHVPKGDALQSEILHFLDCVEHKERPSVSGEAGLAALELALHIQEAVRGQE